MIKHPQINKNKTELDGRTLRVADYIACRTVFWDLRQLFIEGLYRVGVSGGERLDAVVGRLEPGLLDQFLYPCQLGPLHLDLIHHLLLHGHTLGLEASLALHYAAQDLGWRPPLRICGCFGRINGVQATVDRVEILEELDAGWAWQARNTARSGVRCGM